MEYQCLGGIGLGADWDDFISDTENKEKYPNITITKGLIDDMLPDVGDGWIDLIVKKYNKRYIEKFISELIGEKINVKEKNLVFSV